MLLTLSTRFAAAIATVLLLNGCTNQPVANGYIADWDSYQQQLQQQQRWQLSAKMGVRGPSDSGSAYLHWQQAPDNYDIHLSGPLGQGRIRIIGNSEQVTLEQAGKPTLSAPTADRLLQHALGWYAPLEQLKYWVRGLPAPDLPAQIEHNSQGALASLQQSGWHLSYSRYRDEGNFLLPGKLIATQGGLKLTLIIKDWTLN
jgi:outer membrane lipoprotein LolB|tara:strand:- start:566 stop:1168 length:603 start_codon:yes stop_codon:yes gene_type:complete